MIIFNLECLNISKCHHFSIVCHDFNLFKYFFISSVNVFLSIKPIIQIFKNWNDIDQNSSPFRLQCTTYDMKIVKYFFFFFLKRLHQRNCIILWFTIIWSYHVDDTLSQHFSSRFHSCFHSNFVIEVMTMISISAFDFVFDCSLITFSCLFYKIFFGFRLFCCFFRKRFFFTTVFLQEKQFVEYFWKIRPWNFLFKASLFVVSTNRERALFIVLKLMKLDSKRRKLNIG